MLAMIDGQIIFAIGAAIYGVYTWWAEGKKKKEQAELEKRIQENNRKAVERGEVPAPRPVTPAAPAGETSEQERLRRFLEALGVPTGTPPPPQPVRPAPQPQPAAPPRAIPAPRTAAPVPVPRPMYQPAPVVRPIPAPVRPKPQPALVPASEPRDLVRAAVSDPTTAHEQMVERFDRMGKGVDSGHAEAGPVASVRQVLPAAIAGLRDALRSPESLRAAMIAKEILGPPVGL